MSLRATSHGDLQTLSLGKAPVLDGGLYKSFSLSSSNMNGRFGKEEIKEIKGMSRPALPARRPIRVVRPVSANGSFLHINHLQGELVRKRKECEDLKKENKCLSNEIHMERIMMRTESELTMRNLRNLNQELQAQVKELKQKLHVSQQRATLCSRAAEEAEVMRSDAEKSRVLAEARELDSRQEKELLQVEKAQLSEDLHRLKKENSDIQLLLAKTEKNYFESKLKLDRVSSEKQALLDENRGLEGERTSLRHRLKELMEDNARLRDKEASCRRRAVAAEEQRETAAKAQEEAEAKRKLAERERQESTAECLTWREKHQGLAEIFRAQEDLKFQRQNKACQANIKSYFLCMTESDQRVKILKNQDGTPRNFTEGDPIYVSTSDTGSEDPERSFSRTMFRMATPRAGRDQGPTHFSELSPMGRDSPDSGPCRRSRKVVEYFWIPTDEE
ncbi:GRIP and coiled-coil domain-containing protein 2 [Denticeps clupeoides]|uniref:GRIP and coiled-coil domain-containing protein 2 n=1 Tax=Denticeps clupeoides TaxID=299321 RepID=UPI0010A369C4|nr:GRIP and coiled-coil domain-containing protein 2-like [Denticeps clupeoides]